MDFETAQDGARRGLTVGRALGQVGKSLGSMDDFLDALNSPREASQGTIA